MYYIQCHTKAHTNTVVSNAQKWFVNTWYYDERFIHNTNSIDHTVIFIQMYINHRLDHRNSLGIVLNAFKDFESNTG